MLLVFHIPYGTKYHVLVNLVYFRDLIMSVYILDHTLVPKGKEPRKKRRDLSGERQLGKKVDRVDEDLRARRLPLEMQRLGPLMIHNIVMQLDRHDGLIKKSVPSVDDSHPKTKQFKQWRDEMRARDPMPHARLPKHIKNNLAELEKVLKQNKWHEELISSATRYVFVLCSVKRNRKHACI